ncbi:hypothetical protein RHGRI_029521 [Rhododendron griersonianum]|uniref:AP2/ERF domain-containing protein n=1 Tax=Rhododendron griersonianum TaxID=479676 RepID=A0AAV6IJV1_9ERIC|nr:hypothetical protein RHGRI_029521 [Rhododendron griersonianum]
MEVDKEEATTDVVVWELNLQQECNTSTLGHHVGPLTNPTPIPTLTPTLYDYMEHFTTVKVSVCDVVSFGKKTTMADSRKKHTRACTHLGASGSGCGGKKTRVWLGAFDSAADAARAYDAAARSCSPCSRPAGPRPSVPARSMRAAQQQHRFKPPVRPEEFRSNCDSSSSVVDDCCQNDLMSSDDINDSRSVPKNDMITESEDEVYGRRYSVDSSPQDDRVPANNAAAQRYYSYASGSVYLDDVTSSRETIGRGNGNVAERMMRGANRYPIGRNEDESFDSATSSEFRACKWE